ncbi:glycosyltransferase family 2 protein [Crocinitomicaceae bacterium]|nr:glycosyltransferase family 2 protein [Crocinitomicaceae bacterium]
MKISVISPVYNAANVLDEFVRRIEDSITPLTDDYEIILINDASPDTSWKRMKSICSNNNKVVGINLSRNFGQHYAITAGLDVSKGDWIVVMDCDLQDVPEEIPKMYEKAMEGFDAVLAQRINRNDKFLKKFFSTIFYKLLQFLSGIEQDSSVANFGVYSRKVIDSINSMREPIRFFPTMVNFVGFKKVKFPVRHESRKRGQSNYNLKKLLKLAFDVIISNSEKPLRIMVLIGFVISFLSFIIALIYFIKAYMYGFGVSGFASLIISIWLLSGIIIATLGIVGLYVGKTFEYVKKRPIYIIKERIND